MNDLSIILGDDRPDLIKEETLPSLFSKAANEFADKTALIFHDETLTYDGLNRWSDEIALQLLKEGIKRGDKVGVWWQRGLPLHVIILGIVKAGAAYVPVDREIPAERVEVIMQEVGATACYSLQQLNVNCLMLTPPENPGTDKALTSDEINTLPADLNGSDCAYVLYTSGSTGKPKGIPISHGQICHLIRSEQSILQIKSTDKVYQGFPVSFDMWCEETWISYFAGATLWVADNTTSKAIDELSDTLRKENITILHAVPFWLMSHYGRSSCTSLFITSFIWASPHS